MCRLNNAEEAQNMILLLTCLPFKEEMSDLDLVILSGAIVRHSISLQFDWADN